MNEVVLSQVSDDAFEADASIEVSGYVTFSSKPSPVRINRFYISPNEENQSFDDAVRMIRQVEEMARRHITSRSFLPITIGQSIDARFMVYKEDDLFYILDVTINGRQYDMVDWRGFLQMTSNLDHSCRAKLKIVFINEEGRVRTALFIESIEIEVI